MDDQCYIFTFDLVVLGHHAMPWPPMYSNSMLHPVGHACLLHPVGHACLCYSLDIMRNPSYLSGTHIIVCLMTKAQGRLFLTLN